MERLFEQRKGASNISIHFVMEAAGGFGGRGGKERGDFRSTQKSAHLVVAFDIREFDAEPPVRARPLALG